MTRSMEDLTLQPIPDADPLRALLPLLGSIAREIEERSLALEALLVARGRIRAGPSRAALDAECAEHRRELRHARAELEQLGCDVVSARPCVFCVTTADGRDLGLLYWEAGTAESPATRE